MAVGMWSAWSRRVACQTRYIAVALVFVSCMTIPASGQLDKCFQTLARPNGDPQEGSGGYSLLVTYQSRDEIAVYASGNVTFQSILIVSDSDGRWESLNASVPELAVVDGLCPGAVSNAATLRTERFGVVFRPTTPCVELTLTVVQSNDTWFTNITAKFCPGQDNTTMVGCGPPPDVLNAELVSASDDVAAYACLPGFRFDGLHNISCFDDNTWEMSTQTCQDIDECVVRNGIACHNCTNVPGSYVCSCNESYALLGDRCFRSCADPGHHVSGKFVPEGGPFLVNTDLTFSCFEGYRLEGEKVLTCVLSPAGNTSTGWSAPTPTCVASAADEPASSALSSTTIAIIVVCSLAGVALVVLLVVVLVVSHTRSMYRTMAKRRSQSSLQSATTGGRMVRSVSATSTSAPGGADSQYLPGGDGGGGGGSDPFDNRRRSKRNSRMERRSRKFSADSLARANENDFHLTPISGDVSFKPPGLPELDEDEFVSEALMKLHKVSTVTQNSTNAGQFGTQAQDAHLLSAQAAEATDYAAIGPKGELV